MTYFKTLFLMLTAILLSACDMNGMAEKMVPAHILEKNDAVIENVLAANADYFTEFDASEIEKAKVYFEENISKGKMLRKDFVGVNTQTSISSGQKSKNIDLTVEVQTEDGFTLISTNYTLDNAGECCTLRNVTSAKHETSPVRAALETTMKVLKAMGLIFLIGLIGLIVFLVRRSKRKKALPSS
ncbi:MAG: hypothetical protein ABJN69_02800 [Hellea sp.]